jgi:hypothetical protein
VPKKLRLYRWGVLSDEFTTLRDAALHLAPTRLIVKILLRSRLRPWVSCSRGHISDIFGHFQGTIVTVGSERRVSALARLAGPHDELCAYIHRSGPGLLIA